ncbi:testis-specific gene 10 protein-like [Asterias rubens]|uniref:testis-specific gene 10 protein-like n=1 Tax=Asterias rubens TaxID=7604 RepID=UPI0014556C71|nr:testis-specific gene 10 protein-like [Asterias rubens]
MCERENRDLLENYRSATTEAQRWETEASQRSGESSTVKIELMTRDSEMKRLREKLLLLERDVQQHVSTEQAYELQVSSLTRSLANMEESIRQLQDEKTSLVQDLTAVRDLCIKLENTKEVMSRQLTTRNIDTEQLESSVDDQRREIEMLRNQLASQSRELQTLRSRAAQLEQTWRSQRQLTKRISQEFRRSTTLSPTIADNSSFTRTSLMSNHNSSTRRSSSPHRPSSPTRRALSPSRSGRRSPERSILKSSPGYRSSSPDRSTDEYLDGFENG